MVKKLGFYLASVFLFAGNLFAQEVVITLDYPKFTTTEFEGSLVLPFAQGQEMKAEQVRGSKGAVSKDGSVKLQPVVSTNKTSCSWTVTKLSTGRYQFFVSNLFEDDDGTGWTKALWEKTTIVTVKLGGKTLTFTPPEKKTGLVWHVFDLIGENKDLVEVNLVLPKKKTVYGLVKNAATGETLGKVDLSLKNSKGKVISSDTTGPKGSYFFFPEEGKWTVETAPKGYISGSATVDFSNLFPFPRRIDFNLSPNLKTTQFRAVLSWGKDPVDLDAHFTGPLDGKPNAFHISYQNMKEVQKRHFLDVDCRTGFGPETITLGGIEKGTYSYFVHDYTNRANQNSSRLGYSKAEVRLYNGTTLLGTYPVPEGKKGTAWKVFELDGTTGKVKVLNEITP